MNTERPIFDARVVSDSSELPTWLSPAEHTYLIQELRAADGGMLVIVFAAGNFEIMSMPEGGEAVSAQIVRMARAANHAGKIEANVSRKTGE